MAKLYYDESKVVNKIIPSIENTLKKVRSADVTGDSISIPNDFYYYNTLKRTLTEINDIKRDLNNINNWLEQSNKSINKSINKISGMVSNMEPIDFNVRKNII